MNLRFANLFKKLTEVNNSLKLQKDIFNYLSLE